VAGLAWGDVPAVSESSEERTERGGHPGWLAALGLVLASLTVAMPWLAPELATVSGVRSTPVVSGREPTTALPPFVLEPSVLLRHAQPSSPPPAAASVGVPIRLVVPALHVDAPVVPIQAPNGVLLPPSNPQMLGWWDAGAMPGAARGGALITGHTVHTGGGAFDDLETLKPGDRVRVRSRTGLIDYVVSGVTIYRKSQLAKDAQRVFSQTGPGRLVLITCEDWNGSTYLSNAVVFADRA
jgi:LPXTG-site transpeptidase (sortase) family protein